MSCWKGIVTMKRLRIVLLVLFLAIGSIVQAQDLNLIRQKTTRIIAKVDLYWSAVVIAEGFPSFFPLELEVNFPSPRISAELILSPWITSYNDQFSNSREKSFAGGIGLRYYPLKSKFPDAATGFFVEPQYLVRTVSTHTSFSYPPNTPDFDRVSTSSGFFLGLGYQHMFLDRIYLQGRLSAGMGSGAELPSYRVGNNLVLLPWFGFGIGLH